MIHVPEPRALCPECGSQIEATRMDYGYCSLCRDFHAANEDVGLSILDPIPVMGGGFMRCCSTSLRAWTVYHPAPWDAGLLVRCIFSEDPRLHAMRYCTCGYWHWARAMCEDFELEEAT
ncbi:hypothetical protein [Streptomyces sp. Midd1]|uniref:hypothetical protein n=1 Tax=Streptomyces sp. Midd3 TaxID=3161191 RepID=UPI0034DB66A3